MAFLRILEGIRFPALDAVMYEITQLGAETIFLVVALFIFWCVDKREGYYFLSVGFFGTVICQFLKLWFRIPRPWVMDPEFTIVESARAGAAGYSFPSGHTQSAVCTFGGIARFTNRKWLRVLCIVIAVLVPFSRMYLGVHTPLDISVAALVSLVLIFALYPGFRKDDYRITHYTLFGAMVLLAAAYLVFTECYTFPADVDAENLASGAYNAWKLLGATTGVFLIYSLDRKLLRFETDAVWWAQILKMVLGLAGVLAVKTFLKAPLAAICGDVGYAHAIRYFLLVLFAGFIWPISFSFFKNFGKKH